MVLITILLIAVGGAIWYRRWHLMVHAPEQYAKFEEVERKFAHFQVAATERAVKGLLAALRAAMTFIGKRFTKKDRNPPVLGDRQWNS